MVLWFTACMTKRNELNFAWNTGMKYLSKSEFRQGMIFCKEETRIIEIMVIKIKLNFRYANSPKFCWFCKHKNYRHIALVPRAAEFSSGSWEDILSGNRSLQEFKIWYHYKCVQIHYRTEVLKKYSFAFFCFTVEVY